MTQPDPVALNDVADVVQLIKANALGRMLRGSDAGVCACRGTFSCQGNSPSAIDDLPQSEQLAFKMTQIRKLQRQVEEAERRSREPGNPA